MQKLLYTFIFSISHVISFSQTDLIPIDSLLSLEEYKIYIHGPDQKIMVMNEDKSEYITDFSKIRKAVLITCGECKDTFKLSPLEFPNLISLSIIGQFYNELIKVSEFKNLQHLNVMGLSSGEDWFGRYSLFFPPEFWNLKQLQILEIPADHLSDISENIGNLENLQILQIYGFKLRAPHNIPWSIIRHNKLKVLNFYNGLTEQSDELAIMRENVSFKITSGIPLNSKQIIQELEILENSKSSVQNLEIKNNQVVLKNDSLTLILKYNSTQRLNGKSELIKNEKVVQKRKYKNGVAHGKWLIKRVNFTERLSFKNGQPKGSWRYTGKNDYHGSIVIRHKHHYGNFVIHYGFLGIFPSNYAYKNFNNLFYFEFKY